MGYALRGLTYEQWEAVMGWHPLRQSNRIRRGEEGRDQFSRCGPGPKAASPMGQAGGVGRPCNGGAWSGL